VGIFCILLCSMGSCSVWVVQGRTYRTDGTRLTEYGCQVLYDYLEVVLAVCGCGELSRVVIASLAEACRVVAGWGRRIQVQEAVHAACARGWSCRSSPHAGCSNAI
jgi:hypothetical protein